MDAAKEDLEAWASINTIGMIGRGTVMCLELYRDDGADPGYSGAALEESRRVHSLMAIELAWPSGPGRPQEDL